MAPVRGAISSLISILTPPPLPGLKISGKVFSD
nr:MAG TPA_asm: hypothetical protein [Caudoviricetes sp.]